MDNYKIAVLPGDGIGPEIMDEAVKVLKAVEKKYNVKFELKEGLIGGIAIDIENDPLPEKTKKLCFESDAVLLGSIGGPEWDNLPAKKKPEIGGLLAIRKLLNLYANLRPVKIYKKLVQYSPLSERVLEKGVDILIVRELSGGIYFGKPKKVDSEEGLDTMIYDKATVEKIAKIGFEVALKRNKMVTSVDKANVLYSSILWRNTVIEFAKNYKDITLNHLYVDNAAMQLILNPSQFDVILTTNMFGDILSDEAAALSGSLGMLPSASIGERINLYEPAGGSAPDIAGKGIANPVAQILSVAMMLEHSFGMSDAAKDIEKAVEKTINKGIGTKDIIKDNPVSTKEMGDAVVENM